MFRTTDVIEGIRNYVINWANVKKGENVVIVADSLAKPMIVDLVAAVTKGQGANVVVSWIDFNPRQSQGAGPIISGSLKGADKVLRLNFALSHDTGTSSAIQDYGVSIYGVASATPEFFASEAAKFPVEITHAILKRACEKVWATEKTQVRVTDERGTDLYAEGFGGDWGSEFENPHFKWEDMPAVYPRPFPGGITGLLPPAKGNGVAYFDAFSGIGTCHESLKLTFEDNNVVEIEGGAEAAKLRQMLKGIPLGGYLAEIMFGLNPKIRSNAPSDQKPIPSESERRAGRLHIGIGNRPLWGQLWEEMKKVKQPYKDSHLDGFILKPTIYINGEVIIKDGHLTILDDPVVREVAKKYGNPDDLLAEAGPA